MKTLILAGLLALTQSPVLAQSQADVLQATMRPGWQLQNGHYMAGLDLVLAPHWKTYWRAPGETGIPPQFDWSGSENLGSVRLHWPSPQVITLNGMQSIGYHDRLVLPVEVVPLDATKPVVLRLRMDLGVCNDICMPADLTLTQPLGGAPDPAIEAALRQGPISADQAGLRSIACDVAPIRDGMRLQARLGLPVQGSPETVVFETADAGVWVAEATSSRDGATLIASTELVPQSGAPFVMDRSAVTVTVIGQGHSVEIAGCPAP